MDTDAASSALPLADHSRVESLASSNSKTTRIPPPPQVGFSDFTPETARPRVYPWGKAPAGWLLRYRPDWKTQPGLEAFFEVLAGVLITPGQTTNKLGDNATWKQMSESAMPCSLWSLRALCPSIQGNAIGQDLCEIKGATHDRSRSFENPSFGNAISSLVCAAFGDVSNLRLYSAECNFLSFLQGHAPWAAKNVILSLDKSMTYNKLATHWCCGVPPSIDSRVKISNPQVDGKKIKAQFMMNASLDMNITFGAVLSRTMCTGPDSTCEHNCAVGECMPCFPRARLHQAVSRLQISHHASSDDALLPTLFYLCVGMQRMQMDNVHASHNPFKRGSARGHSDTGISKASDKRRNLGIDKAPASSTGVQAQRQPHEEASDLTLPLHPTAQVTMGASKCTCACEAAREANPELRVLFESFELIHAMAKFVDLGVYTLSDLRLVEEQHIDDMLLPAITRKKVDIMMVHHLNRHG